MLISQAAGTGDEVIIVYNTRMPESKGVADYYAERRHVPATQIFGFPLSTNDGMSRAEFRYDLQKPLAEALKKQKLWQIAPTIVHATTNRPGRVEWKPVKTKIRYAVLCYGVPLRVDRDPSFKEEGIEKLRPEMRRDEAAVDNELALLPLIEEKPPVAGPMHEPNLYDHQRRDAEPNERHLNGYPARWPYAWYCQGAGGQGAPGGSGRAVGSGLL